MTDYERTLLDALSMAHERIRELEDWMDRLKKQNDYYVGLLAKIGTDKIEEVCSDD